MPGTERPGRRRGGALAPGYQPQAVVGGERYEAYAERFQWPLGLAVLVASVLNAVVWGGLFAVAKVFLNL